MNIREGSLLTYTAVPSPEKEAVSDAENAKAKMKIYKIITNSETIIEAMLRTTPAIPKPEDLRLNEMIPRISPTIPEINVKGEKKKNSMPIQENGKDTTPRISDARAMPFDCTGAG